MKRTQIWKVVRILVAFPILAVETTTASRGDDSVGSRYVVCHDICVEAAHKCLDQITASTVQLRADRIRVKCGKPSKPA